MKKLLLSAIVILGFSAVSFGQNTASTTATASGIIVTPISITRNTNMNFGTLIASAGSVDLVPGASSPTYNSVSAFTGTGPVTPTTAKFTVDGNDNNTYAITVTSLPTVVTHTDNSTTMAIGSWTSTGSMITFSGTGGTGSGTLSASGTQTFEIGASLTVAANQKAGSYSSSAFTVQVNYN